MDKLHYNHEKWFKHCMSCLKTFSLSDQDAKPEDTLFLTHLFKKERKETSKWQLYSNCHTQHGSHSCGVLAYMHAWGIASKKSSIEG